MPHIRNFFMLLYFMLLYFILYNCFNCCAGKEPLHIELERLIEEKSSQAIDLFKSEWAGWEEWDNNSDDNDNELIIAKFFLDPERVKALYNTQKQTINSFSRSLQGGTRKEFKIARHHLRNELKKDFLEIVNRRNLLGHELSNQENNFFCHIITAYLDGSGVNPNEYIQEPCTEFNTQLTVFQHALRIACSTQEKDLSPIVSLLLDRGARYNKKSKKISCRDIISFYLCEIKNNHAYYPFASTVAKIVIQHQKQLLKNYF